MGGYAGLATGMAFATEYQGEATPHGHGFVSLANMYQHHNLEQIGSIIERVQWHNTRRNAEQSKGFRESFAKGRSHGQRAAPEQCGQVRVRLPYEQCGAR